MTKTLIATIVFNSNKITNECFLQSLYKHTPEKNFDLLVASTSDVEFTLAPEHQLHKNIDIANFKRQYGITTHAASIQKVLEINRDKYDDIIICENDVVVKQNLLDLVDHNFQFVGQNSKTINHHQWWTRLYSKMHFGCQRYLPMLMYFNIPSFNRREVVYEKYDCNLQINIPTLDINFNLKNTWLCDPGWYFMLWTEKNNITCKNIDINDYIAHFWYGSENRNSNSTKTYKQRLEEFKIKNSEYL